MKLQEFFDRQKQASFADIDKLDLYQNILYKQTRKSSTKRPSFIQAKYFVYSTIFVFLLVGVYGMYLFNGGNIQDGGRFSIIKNAGNTVQADYIAQIVDAKGNFFVEHNGVLTKTNNISNGDTILLKEDTQLVFEIDGGTQSKIIGPAKLIVQKTESENYKLNLVYGDFIQMEGKESKKQSIELAINDITVKQEDKNQPINFKFIKEGSNQIFQNNGANIIVTKNNGEEKTATISKEQVITIQNNNIKVFASIENFAKAIQENNISQTFSLIKEDKTEQEDKELTALLKLLTSTTTINENKEEIIKEISSVLSDGKKILEPNKEEQINIILQPEIYTQEIKTLEDSFLGGNIIEFTATYTKIEKRIQNIYQIFDINYSKISGEPKEKLQGLVSIVRYLREKVSIEYNIPPKHIENLQNIEKTLNRLSTQEYGINEIKENITEENIQK